jgi:hypothetical protein
MTTHRPDFPKFRRYYPAMWFALIIIAGLMILLSGCSSAYKAKRCRALNCCESVKDSTVYIEKIKDTVIWIDESETWLDLLFQCDSANMVQLSKVARLETENANLKLQWNDGRLTVYVHKTDTVRGNTVEKIVTRNVVQQVSVPYPLTAWQKFRLQSWLWLAVVIVLYLVWRIYRLFR